MHHYETHCRGCWANHKADVSRRAGRGIRRPEALALRHCHKNIDWCLNATTPTTVVS